MIEGKAMLATLLANASFELPEGETPIPVARITLHSRPGLKLNVTELNKPERENHFSSSIVFP